jgi:hypothetical protein
MLKFLKSLFGMGPYSESRPVDAVAPGAAPYKVPEPVATTPIPYVPEPPLVKLGPEPTVAPVVAKAAPAKKAPAKPKVAAPKAEKAPAKPKAPKKPKISIAK